MLSPPVFADDLDRVRASEDAGDLIVGEAQLYEPGRNEDDERQRRRYRAALCDQKDHLSLQCPSPGTKAVDNLESGASPLT